MSSSVSRRISALFRANDLFGGMIADVQNYLFAILLLNKILLLAVFNPDSKLVLIEISSEGRIK